jgi:4-carboxymuconolactone decarboxylase
MGKTEQMNFHFPRAIQNGVTREELVEIVTHLAYAGWPNAMSAVTKGEAAAPIRVWFAVYPDTSLA